MDQNNDSRYLEIDCFGNAVDCFEKSCTFLRELGDPNRWKWATITLTSGLYHLMICVLERGNYQNVIDFERMPEPKKRQLKLLNRPEDFLQAMAMRDSFSNSKAAHLISFRKALDRIQQEQYVCDTRSTPISVSKEQKEHILMLRTIFRNAFEHFRPMSWWINPQVFLQPMRDTISVATELSKSFNLGIYEEDRRARLHRVLDELPRILDMNERELQVAAEPQD